MTQYLTLINTREYWDKNITYRIARRFVTRPFLTINTFNKLIWKVKSCLTTCLLSTFFYRGGRDHMIVGFTTTCAINAYHHFCCEFEPRLWWGVLDTTLCDKQWLATGRWFSPGTLVSSTNKTDCHVITEILLKVVLEHYKPNQTKPS